MAEPFQYFRPSAATDAVPSTLAELVGLLSYAVDMTQGQPPGHCIRVCWIGMHIGTELGLSEADLSDLYFALVLKDLGCSSNAARICQLYLTDDIQFKNDHKTIGTGVNAALRFVLRQTGPDARLSERVRSILHSIQNVRKIETELIETRCHQGADIAAQMRFSPGVQDGIRCLDEHWDGSGHPCKMQAEEIPVAANIALLSQVVDVFWTTKGQEAAIAEVNHRSGKWFDPRLVNVFNQLAKDPAFWSGLADPDLKARVFALPPALQTAPLDAAWMDDIAMGFSQVIDAKSPFTADHSRRVSLYADMIAEQMGLSGAHRAWLRRAAMLHDLGKLAVSNSILDKPGKLSEAEWDAMRQHSWHSEQILERVKAFADIAPVAGAHHERLDGGGYPYGLTTTDLGLEVRILTVADVFDALSADRPYRGAMPLDKVFGILRGDIDKAFDRHCVEAMGVAIGQWRVDEQARA